MATGNYFLILHNLVNNGKHVIDISLYTPYTKSLRIDIMHMFRLLKSKPGSFPHP